MRFGALSAVEHLGIELWTESTSSKCDVLLPGFPRTAWNLILGLQLRLNCWLCPPFCHSWPITWLPSQGLALPLLTLSHSIAGAIPWKIAVNHSVVTGSFHDCMWSRPRRHGMKYPKIYSHTGVAGGMKGVFQSMVQSPELGNLKGTWTLGGFKFVSSWPSTSFHS